jgi:hypothetical protein
MQCALVKGDPETVKETIVPLLSIPYFNIYHHPGLDSLPCFDSGSSFLPKARKKNPLKIRAAVSPPAVTPFINGICSKAAIAIEIVIPTMAKGNQIRMNSVILFMRLS